MELTIADLSTIDDYTRQLMNLHSRHLDTIEINIYIVCVDFAGNPV